MNAQALGLGSLVLALALGACRPAVQLPPDSATPAVVLDAYLHALVAGDCNTGRQLATGSFGKGSGELCGDAHVTAYRIDGEPARPSADEVVFSTSLITDGSNDGSIQPGEIIWFYSLDRQSNGAWRIVGGGSGP
jgi:hypothetical protein